MTTQLQESTTQTPAPSNIQQDYILLDGSGSMTSKWWDALTAIQGYVDTLRTGNVGTALTLHIFDGDDLEYVPHRQVPIADWKSLLDNPVGHHGGSTPLYDAINLMGRRLRDLNPPRCSIVIVTDGKEAGSTHTNLTQAKAILDWCRAKGWQVTFIGAGFDNSKTAKALGAGPGSAIGTSPRMLTDAVSALGKKRAAYGLYGTPMHYTADEQQTFGGYLSAPEAK